jgi:ABC-2 type transport system permease protein
MFVRNRQALFFTIIMPVIIMSVFGLLGFDKVAKINIGYAVTAPPTAGTAAFIDQLKQVEAFDLHGGTEPDERQAIQDGDRSAVFIVPYDLVPDQPTGETHKITILTNAGDTQQAGIAVNVMQEFLNQANLAAAKAPILFGLDVQQINSNNLKYIDFLVPGIVALSLMQMSVFSVAFVFTNYKEKGILKRLLATPVKPSQFVAANVITRLIVAVVQAALLIAVGVLLFHAHVVGSYWLILLTSTIGAIMFLGLGFTISGISSTVETVPALANLVVFPMLFLGGTFFPLDVMPTWLQHIAKYLPLQYLSDALRQVMTKDVNFAAIQSDLLWMVGWSVVLVTLANITFGFEEKRI